MPFSFNPFKSENKFDHDASRFRQEVFYSKETLEQIDSGAEKARDVNREEATWLAPDQVVVEEKQFRKQIDDGDVQAENKAELATNTPFWKNILGG